MFCSKCGSKVNGNFCPTCGSPVNQQNYPSNNAVTQAVPSPVQPQTVLINNIDMNRSDKNKWVAFILCLLFGYLGIHRFYVGKIGTGMIYLFTFGIGGLGWVIDGICILCGSFADKKGNFLKE